MPRVQALWPGVFGRVDRWLALIAARARHNGACCVADLGTAAAEACLERAGCPAEKIDRLIFGHGRQAGCGPNTARQIAYRAGVLVESPAYTINQACASGLQSVISAAHAILLGEADVLRQKPSTLFDQSLRVGAQICVERSHDWRQYAGHSIR